MTDTPADQQLVEVQSFGSALVAEEVREYLEQNGIDALVLADDAGGAIPALGMTTGGARLLVRAEDLSKARDLLQSER
jgi:hypothetical protein